VLKGSSIDGEVEGEGAGLGDVDWVLVEDVEVQCSWWMMPLVRGKMEEAHRDICKKVVEKVVMEKQQEAVARSVEKGKGRAQDAPGWTDMHGSIQPLPEKIRYG